MEKKDMKGKPIKEVVFSTRNKAVILHSKMYGIKKTNEILEATFSNDNLVSKLLDAEKYGFRILYGSEDIIEWIALIKEIYKPELDSFKCEEKYWDVVRENLLKLYDNETTEAIIEHYHPLILEDGSELLWNWITDLVSDDTHDAKKLAVYIEFCPNYIKKYSNIEKKGNNKIIKYPIKWEEVASVFIDSHIQVFGKFNREENEPTKSKPIPKDDVEEFIPRYDIGTLYVKNASEYLNFYRKYIPEMFRLGLKAWLDKHPHASTFSMTTKSMDNLRMVLNRSMHEEAVHATPIEKEARRFLTNNIMLEFGLTKAVEVYDWQVRFKSMCEIYPSAASSVPNVETFKKMVLDDVWRLVPDVYGDFY